MSSNELLKNKIEIFFSNHINSFQIYYIQRNSTEDEQNPYRSYYIDMGKSLNNCFAKEYREKLIGTIANKPEVDFDVVVSEDDAIEKIASSEVANRSKISNILNPFSAQKASENEFDIKKIWGYAVVYLNDKDEKLILYRKYATPKALSENKKLLFMKSDEGEVKLLDKEFISIDMKIDVIDFNDKLYILSRHYFHQFFSFGEAYIKCVDNSFNNLKAVGVIDNFDEFSERCKESSNLVKKLVKVIKEDRLKWLSKNMNSAKSVVSEYKLRVKIEDDKIKYSKADCKISDVMKLICGCCVKDAVDMQKYFASSVREIGN